MQEVIMRDCNGTQLYCQCGKAIYSQKEAFQQLKHFRSWKKINNKAKRPIRCYRCNICNEWHLTAAKKKDGKKCTVKQSKKKNKMQ